MAKLTDKIFTPAELQGKFIIGYDTMVQGNLCVTTDKNKKSVPCLFESEEEAFKELFDSHMMELESQIDDEDGDLPAKTKKKLPKMVKVYQSGDVAAMRKFLEDNPDCELSEEFIEKAEDFIFGRKAFFPSGVQGTKLQDLTYKIVKETM